MFKKLNLVVLVLCGSFVLAQELTQNEQEIIKEKTLEEFAKIIFSNAMEAKRAFLASETREEIIENFSTTAPMSLFEANADIDSELAAGVESSTIYVSTDNQGTWQSAPAILMGTPGYEDTWQSIIETDNGSSSYSYLSGYVDSGVLDYEYGNILVSGSPHNENGDWPPGNNLYALLASDPSGDASSSYDITSINGTYLGSDATDGDGNSYTDVERFYIKLSLNGGCCDEGGLFGPWYLYGVAIVNPDADSNDGSSGVAYAIGYGDGGFGQLTPGVLKITGDLVTGDIEGFEYLTTNISYNTNGNDLQATTLMSHITDDDDWGDWPNSFNGFIVLGVTVEAALDGLDVAAEMLDQTDPGLFIADTQSQVGNVPLVLSAPNFDETNNTLSVNYSDSNGNLPWFKAAQICNTPENGGNCFTQINMIPDGHDYESGATFTATITDDLIDQYELSGDYEAHFWFADDDIEEYPSAQIELGITIGAGGCALVGDTNEDNALNVLDVVLLVNIILDANSSGSECSDVNGDGAFNVLDVVLLVNLILNP